MSILDDCPGEGYKLCRKKLHWYTKNHKQCPECAKIQYERTREQRRLYSIWWREQNPELVVKQNKENYEKNKEHIKALKQKQRKEQPEKYKTIYQKWRENNKEKARENTKKWRRKNPHKIRETAAARKARRMQALPSWANKEKIKQIYKEAARLTQNEKKSYQVDHVYPLRSNYMCGLHVETNLQILTAEENQRKGNRTWPGQLDCQKGSVYDIFPKELTDLLNDQEN